MKIGAWRSYLLKRSGSSCSKHRRVRVQTTKFVPLAEPWLPTSYADSVRDQVLSGFLGPGQRVQEFAGALGAFVGSPHCLLTVSGTIALSVAARAVGIKAGEEILVPAYGVISTINAFSSIGLTPKLVDIDGSTGCISLESLKANITEKTRAVCFVNFSGYTGSNVVEVKKLCDEAGIPLIEDAACALGHSYQGISAGMFGTVGIYSFSVPKVLTTGQGGALVTKNSEVFAKAAAFIDQGDLEWRKTNINRDIGTNLRFTDILAVLGHCQLKDMHERLERRNEVYLALQEELEGRMFAVPGNQAPLHNIVFTKQAERLIGYLKSRGISATGNYRTLSEHPAYSKLARNEYPHSDFWTRHAVYLPFGMALTSEDAKWIGSVVRTSGIELLKI